VLDAVNRLLAGSDFILECRQVVPARGYFVLNRFDFILARGDFVLARGKFVLNRSDFILNRPDFVLNRLDFVLARVNFVLARHDFVFARGKTILARVKTILARGKTILARGGFVLLRVARRCGQGGKVYFYPEPGLWGVTRESGRGGFGRVRRADGRYCNRSARRTLREGDCQFL
jgi:hypothetical protein